MVSTSNLFYRGAPGSVQAGCLSHSRRFEGDTWVNQCPGDIPKSGVGSTGIVKKGVRSKGVSAGASLREETGDFEENFKITKLDLTNHRN